MGSYSSPFCVLVTILLCFVSSVISQPDLLVCGTNGNYTNNSTYQKNLNNVFTTINSNAQNDYWWYNISSGGSSDSANVIALCRGDVKQAECNSCLKNSTQELTQVCPYQKEAVGWYEKCMLRYSNSSSIFGRRASGQTFYMWNVNNVTNSAQFNGSLGDLNIALGELNIVLGQLMGNLSNIASSGDSRRKFATGEFEKVYGLVECTPDLTRKDCSSCITESIRLIPTCCQNKKGVRVINPSCSLRFESSEFFDTAPPLSTPPPPPVETMEETNTTNSKGKSQTIIIVVVSVVATVVVVLIALIFIYLRSKKPRKYVETMGDEVITMESLQYNFSTIKIATDDFSDANKLGQGGFGAVYKGTLLDGREIAVKRLKSGSDQGDKEFNTEVTLLANLQHRGLVKLLGFCREGKERLLIYEFVLNKSLNKFLFDKVKRSELDWGTRYKIIGGIVEGLLYLHEDSPLRIIHRDLKADNILLDAEMNPKIADFGLARLFGVDQTHVTTINAAGTPGYMSPEYLKDKHFSVKSDVYSFGVLVLEIVSGNKNTWCESNHLPEDLISYAWQNWMDGTLSNLIDPTLTTLTGGSNSEIMRCIHIGLLSVQENASDRPTMAKIVTMLNSNSTTIPIPSLPSSYHMPQIVESDARGRVSINDVSITEMYPR